MKNNLSEKKFIKNIENSIQKMLKELSAKVYAECRWVFESYATLTYNKERELADYKYGEEEFEKKKDLTVKNLLEEVTKIQAAIFWYFKGRKIQPSKRERDNDYYDAKKYISFIITDMMIEKCKNKNICPILIISQVPDYIEYLENLTIYEYTKYKAFLKWKSSIDKGIVTDDKNNYFEALGYLDDVANNNCEEQLGVSYSKLIDASKQFSNKITGINNLQLLKNKKFDTIDWTSNHNCQLRTIAETSELKDIIINYIDLYKDIINDYSNIFYKNLNELIQETNISSSNNSEETIAFVYKGPYARIVNMLEFFLKCIMVNNITLELHNKIRLNNYKPSIKNI